MASFPSRSLRSENVLIVSVCTKPQVLALGPPPEGVVITVLPSGSSLGPSRRRRSAQWARATNCVPHACRMAGMEEGNKRRGRRGHRRSFPGALSPAGIRLQPLLSDSREPAEPPQKTSAARPQALPSQLRPPCGTR